MTLVQAEIMHLDEAGRWQEVTRPGVAQAAVDQTKALADNAQVEAERRQKLGDWASEEERQTFMSRAMAAQATHQQAVANLAQAQVNLKRARIESPVNGYVTNLQAQLGDYVMVGERRISVVNSDSFWIDGYFEETVLGSISIGDPARAKLMGYSDVVTGHVDRSNQIQPTRTDKFKVQIGDPIDVWTVQELAENVLANLGTHLLPDQEASVAIDQEDCDDRQQQTNQNGADGVGRGRSGDLMQRNSDAGNGDADQGRGVFGEDRAQRGI